MDAFLLRPFSKPHRFFSPSLSQGCCTRLRYSFHRAGSKTDICSIRTFEGCLANCHVKHLNGKSAYCRIKLLRKSAYSGSPHERNQVNVTSENHSGSEPEAHALNSFWNSIAISLNVFYRFSRPHTVIGTAMSIISVSLLAVEKLSDLSPLFVTGLLEAIVAALFMNIYIVGLNQLFDIEIDKVNKPYLPLASGEYSLGTGTAIVSASAVMSFGMACFVGSWPLFWALFISFLLGTAYSINLPHLRWKRFAVVAAMCILAVRAVVVQLAFFLHIQTFVFGRPANFSRPLIFATAFMSFFSVVIALFKDIPDIDGDRIFGIRSFSVRLGQRRVFWACIYLLEVAYSVAMLIGVTSSCNWSKFVTFLGHAALASILWNHAQALDFKNKAAITSFYMFIWKLFYAEYLLIPLVR